MADPEHPSPPTVTLCGALREWWADRRSRMGVLAAVQALLSDLRQFAWDSTPEGRRRRYGDVEYDWDFRVNTTSAAVGWRDRLLGVFHSPYQPTEPTLFHAMMGSLPVDFRQFTFIDLGSGKGRTLVMASDYGFRRILGVELLPELHRIAQENLRKYRSPEQKCRAIEARCGDARDFESLAEATVLYLFNPFTEAGLSSVVLRLEASLKRPSTCSTTTLCLSPFCGNRSVSGRSGAHLSTRCLWRRALAPGQRLKRLTGARL